MWDSGFSKMPSAPEVLQHIHLWKFFHVPQMEEAFQEMQQDKGTNSANKSDEKSKKKWGQRLNFISFFRTWSSILFGSSWVLTLL